MATRPPRWPAARPPTGPLARLRLTVAAPTARRRLVALAFATPGIIVFAAVGYFWISYGRLIESKLRGEEDRPIPRIFARPYELHPGEPLTSVQLVQQLNDLGYAERPNADAPGEFALAPGTVTLVPRTSTGPKPPGMRVDFGHTTITRLTTVGTKGPALDSVTLEAPLVAALAPGEKRRYVPLASIPKQMIDAVLSIEDKRFFEHPGVDPIRAMGALLTNLRGNKPYLVGGSTLTQQIVKNTFLTPEKTLRRKMQEQFMALVLESRFSKAQILELYLNDVVLGQRGPFEIHGVGEAARIFFGVDVSNVTLAQAATIAGVIQSPSRLSPFRNPDKTIERRNLVLHEMAVESYVTAQAADTAAHQPLGVLPRALENEAPYFVDYVSAQVDEQGDQLFKKDSAVDVYTTIDLNLQRMAQETVATGLDAVDKILAARHKKEPAEAALLAVDPRTGEILAMVGGRAYNLSQYNRAVDARRQPGSTFKPFVYLAAFERMADEDRADLTPATIINDAPTTFEDGDHDYTPSNYQNEYDGPITLREALARSRNIVAIKVAQQIGYDRVVALWNKVGVGTPAKPYPAVALGVFEASPLEMATAYTLFDNRGTVLPLRAIRRLVEGGVVRPLPPPPPSRPIAREATTFLVTNMMRSVLDEGTGAPARADGFTLDAAGKSGTTQDLRDAWFIGFTPELLTVVWVGLDSNQPIGLTGSEAALPIWTAFMKRALAGHPSEAFDVPDGITFADIDRQTGRLATASCPDLVVHEAFLAGTEPKDGCDSNAVGRLTSRLGRFLAGLFSHRR